MPRGDATPERVREHALALFARHGVAGTSLQQIADSLGVTKAAVYHRFRTKEEIVFAVLAPAYDDFARLLDEVGRLPEADRPLRLVHGLAGQAVTHRDLYAVVVRDVSAAQFQRDSPAHRAVLARLHEVLLGADASPVARVRVGIFLTGLTSPAVDPDAATMDDATLEAAIVAAGRGLLGLG